jgi:hypothetical protein
MVAADLSDSNTHCGTTMYSKSMSRDHDGGRDLQLKLFHHHTRVGSVAKRKCHVHATGPTAQPQKVLMPDRNYRRQDW